MRLYIGDNLKHFREEKGLTQRDVAIKLGIAQNTVSSWETDRTEPNLTQLAQLADLYGITREELVEPVNDDKLHLSSIERSLVIAFRESSPERRAIVLDILKVFECNKSE